MPRKKRPPRKALPPRDRRPTAPPKDWINDILLAIEMARLNKQMSVRQVAKEAQISHTAYRYYMNRERTPGLNIACRIAAVVGLRIYAGKP